MNDKKGIIIAGGLVGIISVLLVYFGNPANMGFCIACFLRDISGGIGLHRADVVQYIRPEIIGLVLGAFFISLKNKEFQTKGGSSPFTRFMLGIAVKNEIDLKLIKALRIKDLNLKRDFYFVHCKNRTLSPLVEAFKDFVIHWNNTKFKEVKKCQ